MVSVDKTTKDVTSSMPHILIIRFSSLGDVLLATSAVAFWRKKLGRQVKISFLTFTSSAAALGCISGIDHIYTVPKKKLWSTAREIFLLMRQIQLETPVHLIWDLQGSLLSSLVRKIFFLIPSLVIDKRKWERFLLLFLRWNIFKPYLTHYQRLWLDFSFLLPTHIQDELPAFQAQDYFLPHVGELVDITDVQNSARKVVFVPTAAHHLKRWPIEFFHELLKRCDDFFSSEYAFYILVGKNDDFCLPLKKFHSKKNRLYYYSQGDLSFAQSAQLVMKADLVVGNDTGLMHVALFNKTKAITLFGPTSEYFGFAPMEKMSHIQTALSIPLWCRPCSATGAGNCWRKSHACMQNLSVQLVMDQIQTMMTSLQLSRPVS